MDRLEPDERRLLDDYVAARTPDGAAVARALVATLHRVEHGPVPTLDEPERRASAVWARVAMFAIAAAAIVLIAWRGLALLERGRAEPVESAPMIAEPEQSQGEAQPQSTANHPEASTTISEDRPQGDPHGAGPIPPEPAAEPSRPARSADAPKRHASGGSDLAAELALLRDADTSLDRGDARRALALLDEHARKFPRGQMVPERLLQKAIALCKLGKREKSRATVDKLLRTYPTTPLRARASAVCADEDTPR